MRPLVLRLLATLVLIWAAVAGIIWWAHSAKATPESMAAYVAAHPVDGRSPAQREKVMETVARQLNQLEYEQRRDLRVNKRLDSFYKSLSAEEQGRFLDLTVPAGMKQMMEAFNKMDPTKRKEMVDKALAQMKAHAVDVAEPNHDDPQVKKIIESGLQSFYSDASVQTKLDLAPLIEQIQKNVQGMGQ